MNYVDIEACNKRKNRPHDYDLCGDKLYTCNNCGAIVHYQEKLWLYETVDDELVTAYVEHRKSSACIRHLAQQVEELKQAQYE